MGTRVFLYTKREKSIKIYGSHFSEKGTRIEIKKIFSKNKISRMRTFFSENFENSKVIIYNYFIF